MEAIRDTQKRYCSSAMILAIIAGIILIVMGEKALSKGLVLGTIFSVLNFIVMGRMLPMRLGKSKGPSIIAALYSVSFRYVLLAVPIIVAINLEQVDIITAIIGIFMIQIVIIADHFGKLFTLPRKHTNIG